MKPTFLGIDGLDEAHSCALLRYELERARELLAAYQRATGKKKALVETIFEGEDRIYAIITMPSEIDEESLAKRMKGYFAKLEYSVTVKRTRALRRRGGRGRDGATEGLVG